MLILELSHPTRKIDLDQKVMQFDLSGGSIGRCHTCTWTIPDPDCLVSRYHAIIQYEDGHFHLIDVSKNGVFVKQSDRQAQKEKRLCLKKNDEVLLGYYGIRVVDIQIPNTPSLPPSLPFLTNNDHYIGQKHWPTTRPQATTWAYKGNRYEQQAFIDLALSPFQDAQQEQPESPLKHTEDAPSSTTTHLEDSSAHSAQGASLLIHVLSAFELEATSLSDEQRHNAISTLIQALLDGLLNLQQHFNRQQQRLLQHHKNTPGQYKGPSNTHTMNDLMALLLSPENQANPEKIEMTIAHWIKELKAHPQALFQAIRPTLLDQLDQLAPDRITEAMPKRRLLASQTATAWDHYLETYHQIVSDLFEKESQDWFNDYAKHYHKLRKHTHPRG